MKGIIPAAGMGTRLKPYTNAIPKELLPVCCDAVVKHVIDAFRDIPGNHNDVGTPEDLHEANRLFYLREK